MPRIPLIDVSDVPGPLGDTLRSRPPAALYRVLAHAPTIAPGFIEYGLAVLRDMALDPALRELVILRVAQLSGSAYEIAHHRPMALKAGLTTERIEAVLQPTMGEGFSPMEHDVLAFTEEVVSNIKASDLAYARVATHLPPRCIVELLMTIGQYMGLARLLANLEIEVDHFLQHGPHSA